MSDAQAHHLGVTRTARYYTLGPPEAVREVWVVLHGYGQLASYFIRHFKPLVGTDRLIVAPEGLSRAYLPGHQRVGASWMTKEDREAEIGDYLGYLDTVAAHILDPLSADVPVHALGFSQGATTACRWAVLGKTAIHRLVLWAGSLPHDLDYTAQAATLRRLDLTLVAGTGDAYVKAEHVAQQQALLDEHAISYRFLAYEGEHRLHAETLRRVVEP